MPRTQAATALKDCVVRRGSKTKKIEGTSRYSVALPSALARQVETCAVTSDISVSKTIVGLVRLGLRSQEARKREFFRKLRKNLANDNPKIEEQMVDEFRALILGH
jgi:hypothetical protein